MSSIPPLDYLMEKEAAREATRNFSFSLQEVFKEYKNVWNMYLDLVKKCEDNNSRPSSGDKIEIAGQRDDYKCTESLFVDEEDVSNSVHAIENILPPCTLDFQSNIEESNEGTISEIIRRDVSKSPVFCRNSSIPRNTQFERSNSISSPLKSTIVDNDLNNDDEQENSDQITSAISASSTTYTPSVTLCNTPIKSKKWSINKKRNVKRSVRSKIAAPSSSLKKKNNLINIRKEKANKVPLQIVNNVSSVSKNIYQTEKNNSNKSYNVQVTMSPSSRKFKQTKLIFHKTKKTVELSNNLKTTNISQTTKTDGSPSDQIKNLKQSTLTNSIGLKERGSNDKHIGNNYNRVEVKDLSENNFVHIYTNTQIKNELIVQEENTQTNTTQLNDPLNTSNESDSIFFSETDHDTNLNKSHDTSFNYNRTHVSLNKNEFESTNERCKKRHINSLGAKKNITEIIDEDENCKECERYGKKHCSHYRSIFYKRRNTPTSSWNTMLPDSPSSTT